MRNRRYTSYVGMLLAGLFMLACSDAVDTSKDSQPDGGSLSGSGGPPIPGPGGTTSPNGEGSTSGGSSGNSAADDSEKLPSDIKDPPTVIPAVCGNKTVETGEQCDDGNTLSWDGCTSVCKTETEPTESDQFATATTAVWTVENPVGSVTFATPDTLASDQRVAKLTFFGGQGNAAGTDYATEIFTNHLLGFGMYRARFNFAKCNSGEDVTNGIFVYSRGGTHGLPKDSNANGITDNNEIDIELWCGNPKKLYLTVWTDYGETSGTETFRKVTRVFDLITGKAYETPVGKENTYDIDYKTVKATIPEMVIPNMATDEVYYEMGFEWHSNAVRYFIVLSGKEITLWTLDNNARPNGASYIPQNKAFMMFNVWYPTWSGKSYPASDASLKVDWFKYWAN